MWPAENLNEKKVCLNVRSIEKIKCNLSISCKTLLSLTQFPSKQIDVLRSTDRDVMRLGLVDGKRLATASTRKKNDPEPGHSTSSPSGIHNKLR